ncbi:MAG: hypothetical protein ACLPXB_02125 [Thiobacillaceae bacterium]
MKKRSDDLSVTERLRRRIEAVADAAERERSQDETQTKAKVILQALAGTLAKAADRGAAYDTLVSVVMEELGIGRRAAANALRPFFKHGQPPSGTGKEESLIVMASPLSDTPRSNPRPAPKGGKQTSSPIQATLTSRSMNTASASLASSDRDEKSLPPLPADLMPKDGKMPPVPAANEYRIEPRSDGVTVYVINTDRYSLLPGIDPTAPYGRYVDGRPMNEYGAPIGEGPPVMYGKFLGENF